MKNQTKLLQNKKQKIAALNKIILVKNSLHLNNIVIKNNLINNKMRQQIMINYKMKINQELLKEKTCSKFQK